MCKTSKVLRQDASCVKAQVGYTCFFEMGRARPQTARDTARSAAWTAWPCRRRRWRPPAPTWNAGPKPFQALNYPAFGAHQASKSSRDRPLCSMDGVAMTTLAPTPSSARALDTCCTCLNTKGLAACAHTAWLGLHALGGFLKMKKRCRKQAMCGSKRAMLSVAYGLACSCVLACFLTPF